MDTGEEKEWNQALEEERDEEEMRSNDSIQNYWSKWGQEIHQTASKYFKEKGTEENPFYLYNIKLSKKILQDMALFPIWSNIFSPYFNGRVPATSAPVEGEFNKFKNTLLFDVKHPIRVDECVDRFLNYLNGKTKIVQGKLPQLTFEDSCSRNEEVEEEDDAMIIDEIEAVYSSDDENTIKKRKILGDIENWKGKGFPTKKPTKNTGVKVCIFILN